jgi:hypothetical protein
VAEAERQRKLIGACGDSRSGERARSACYLQRPWYWFPGRVDAPAGDPRGDDSEELFSVSAGPWLDTHFQGCCPFRSGVHVVRGALEQNAPALSRGEVIVVNLKADFVLCVRYPGAKVFVKRAVLRGTEKDGSLMQLVIDWEHCHAGPAGISDPADAARRDQPQALSLIQLF